MDKPPVTVPIILLNWNGLEDTRACLESLEQQTWANFMVYLLDNGSELSEGEQLRAECVDNRRITYIRSDENIGFTRGVNLVLEKHVLPTTTSPYVVLLNNDTVTDPRWLEVLISAAEGADMVASKMINHHAPTRMDNAGHTLLNTLEVLPIGHNEPVDRFETALDNVGPCGGAALYSTGMLRDIGTFDTYFHNGYEDVELGLRGILCGYRSVYAPGAVVYHKISRSVNKLRDLDYTVRIQRNVYFVTGKLMPLPILLLCGPFVVLRLFVALIINLVALRPRYLKIQILALRDLFTKDLKVIRAARARFAGKRRISAFALLGKMEFFLKQDLKRFNRYILRREKMVFEKYQ